MENTSLKKGLFKTLAERSKAETPPFFKKLRLIGLTLAAVGGILVASPVAIPAAIVTVGGYLILAGSVATAVSQVTVQSDESKKKDEA
ncbi:MAG: hypothetical protein ABIP51_00455 [Bacteroidia bacterium]